jgi:hypothetical protein
MPTDDMNDLPLDLGAAIHMIGRLRAEVQRRPRLTVVRVDQTRDPLYADTLQMVQPGQVVTITLETDRHTFQFTAIPSGGGLGIVTTKG